MKLINWQVYLGIILLALSAALYFAHFLIFRDARHILIYLLGDLAFLPVEVLLVTVIIHQILSMREKKAMLNKMNMVIGAFFSEVGNSLLSDLSRFDLDNDRFAAELSAIDRWTDRDFNKAFISARTYEYSMNVKGGELAALKDFLGAKRQFLLVLLENPNLLEHESFTDVLWAVFHLTEELLKREDLGRLPDTDLAHLKGDIRRVYGNLIAEWLGYIRHLRKEYPYLYSLAVRTNPFNHNASPVVLK